MRSPSMYTRIMGVVLAVVLLLTIGVAAVSASAMRSQQINARLDALKKDAREIAVLAAAVDSYSLLYTVTDSTAYALLQEKAAQVYQEYGAFLLVVDRRGRTMHNLSEAYAENPDFVESLNTGSLSEALVQVLEGNEISVRTMVNDAPTFTVGVPYRQNDVLMGAVLIQTPAQTVEGNWNDWLPLVVLLAVAAVVLAALCLMFFIRAELKPVRQVVQAARAMADGDFQARVATEKGSPEIRELATSFNQMADRLADTERSRKEFVANVSHELRSPITSIAGYVKGMEDGVIPPEEHAHYLSIVSDETTRLSKLISQLLALSRLERDDAKLEETDFDMCEMLRRAVIRRMNELERKRLEIVCDFTQEPCMVHADSDRIEQVVINLLDNAIRFTPEGGRIILGTEAAGSERLIRVRDNGCGISEEDRPHVFERFFTADRAHTAGKGTGLGLAISQRIMEMHGTRLRLEDTPEGASFIFTLPGAENVLPVQAKSDIMEA